MTFDETYRETLMRVLCLLTTAPDRVSRERGVHGIST